MAGVLRIETAVHCLHIREPGVVFGVDVGQFDLKRCDYVLLD